MAFMPENSALVVLAFLFTCFLLLVGGVSLLFALVARKPALAGKVLAASLVVVAGYLAILLGVSFRSRERLLGLHEWKYFCEIDCHQAMSVVQVARAKTAGSGPNQRVARGTFYTLTLKVWFDERTIGATRGHGPLHPDPRFVGVVDEQGRSYRTTPEAERSLERSLRPGESYTAELVFDLPDDARNPRLLVTDASWIAILLIGHEKSFFHKKVMFQLIAPAA